MIEIDQNWLDERRAFLLRKESERTKRERSEWAFIEKGYGRKNVYSNRGEK